ncbi:MAG TPA: FG-GAP-like repeat-containing protein [Candidatus Polarisedimenticolaceae bacterium]|nr:FG-GAP-like repeat-containing protein [Candidatus Polarisedimenticolaceae bacterium]
MKRTLSVSLALALALMASSVSWGQSEAPAEGKRGDMTVGREVFHDISPPLMLMPLPERPAPYIEHEPGRIPLSGTPAGASGRTEPDRNEMRPAGPAMPSTNVNVLGQGQDWTGYYVGAMPPDTNGDVGPQHYIQLVNSSFEVFDKSGKPLYGPYATAGIWQGVPDCGDHNDGDGIVLYDPIANRWVISQFSIHLTSGYLECVAVSATGDPMGQWYRYAFSYDQLPDYPKLGVWPDAYYVSYNMFDSSNHLVGGKVCALDRASMLVGHYATQVCVDVQTAGLLPADLDGDVLPPPGAPMPFVAINPSDSASLLAWNFHVDFVDPWRLSTFVPMPNIPVPTWYQHCGSYPCVPQPNGDDLSAIDDRLMYRLAYRNFGDHDALVVNHTVETPGTPVSTTGVRWYEIRSPFTKPFVFQQGTQWADDGAYRWMGSAAIDQAGDIALGYSLSSSALTPQIRYAGRLVSDPRGTTPQGEATLFAGAGSQGYFRWGDYSMMAVDPADDCTFWYTSEYEPADGYFNWDTRVGAFKFPGCPGPVTAVSNGPVCAGGTLQLAARGPKTGTYTWTGPSGFTSSTKNPVLSNVTAAMAGIYTLTHTVGGVPTEIVATGVVIVPNGGLCSDGNACTEGDSCQAGACVGGTPKVCAATACSAAGTCDPATGLCPARPDGTVCNDGDPCVYGDACRSGVCVAQSSTTTATPVAVSGPVAAAVDDLNFDGIPDLAVVGGTAGTLQLVVGLGGGAFSSTVTVPVGPEPSAVATGDFTWNGLHSVAVADAQTGLVTLYSPFGFTPMGSTYYGGNGASAMIAADFNGDGHDDLAVALNGGVSILLNVAPNQLYFSWQEPAGIGLTSIAAGDLNGDGFVDLAVTGGGSNDVTILLGDGTGGLHAMTGSPFRVGRAPSGVALGDFDGDGALDLAVANRDSSDVSILLNRGSSGFFPAPGSPIALDESPLSIAAADFSRDGRPDLAIAGSDGTLTLLSGGGGGRFGKQQVGTYLGLSAAMLLARDVNGDGSPDLVVVNRGQGAVNVALDLPFFANGARCDYGDACTMGSCSAGACQPGTAPKDLDADGHIVAGCPGGDDCNDLDGTVWHPPAGVTGLTVSGQHPTSIAWASQAGTSGPGTVYDLVVGYLYNPPVFSNSACLESGGGTSFIDIYADPQLHSLFYYLSRARNSCGTGTWGSSLADATMAPCP